MVQCPSTRSYLPLPQLANLAQPANACVQHFSKLWLTYTVARKSEHRDRLWKFCLWLYASQLQPANSSAAVVVHADLKHDKLSLEGA